MKKVVLILAICICASATSHAETITIGGSGSMIPLLTELGKAYMKKHPASVVAVKQQSMGQPGGIAALNAGAIDIAMSAMPISPDQAKLQIEQFEIARVAGVVAVSSNVKATNLTSRQLCDMYAGKIKNWKQVGGADAPIAVYTRPESDSTKIMFRKSMVCMATLKEAPEILNLPKSADMYNALSSSPNAIGPVDVIALVNAAGKFKEIKIDGMSHVEMEKGKWPFVLKNNLVLRKKRSEAVNQFLMFVKSPEGREIIKREKAVPSAF
ncbi:MAG: substrate-binding domain-containing protein [Desulfuromonadales bacterium]|nr:substrate-binding domain-containing protein [Desulfuromonadales bacterium]